MIAVNFYLSSIDSFKEDEDTVSITGSFNFNWTDPFLAWNPSSYGNVYMTIIDSDMCVPFIVLANSGNTMESVGGGTKFKAFLLYTGDVIYDPEDNFETKCPTYISKFPFDKQNCFVDFMAWGIPKQFITLSSLKSQAIIDDFYPHSSWRLLEYSTATEDINGISLFYINLRITGRAMYYGVMVIAPTVLFALLNPLVFLLPVESGERVGLAMTIFLSYKIFVALVSSSIPASSNPMCALLIVMIIIIVVSGNILFAIIISVNYFNEEDVDKIRPALRRFVLWQLPKDNNIGELKEVKRTVTGKDVAIMLDTIFFYTSYLILVITVLCYFVYVAM